MIKKILHYLDLRSELEDFDRIHNEIEKGILFKGTNLWILVFAIIVASIGLNTNSTAVIIGAMLISPLMGPINGMGYGIATYNFTIFKTSIRNFIFSVLASLFASTLYFSISPVSTAHSELLARTSPTIYDVLIAFFGGLAGIVAISTRLKGNVITGVAIATALMPPLCTAGYGLATGQYAFFFGAFYLFTINTVFIAISSVVMSKVLNFPSATNILSTRKKKLNQYLTLIILITLLPSIYFGYLLAENEKFSENAKIFSKSITFFEGNYLLKQEIEAENKTLRLIFGGNSLTEKNKEDIIEKAKYFDLADANLIIQQGFSTTDALSNSEIDILRNKLNLLTQSLKKDQITIDSLSNNTTMGKQILQEIKPLYNQINSCLFSEGLLFSSDNKPSERITFIFFFTDKKSLDNTQRNVLIAWLKARLQKNNIKVFFEEN